MRKPSALLLIALFLSSCAGLPFGRSHTAALVVGEKRDKVLRSVAHLHSGAVREWTITGDDGKPNGIQVITLSRAGTDDMALFFYNGLFVDLGRFSPEKGFSPIRTDYQDIKNRKEGPDVFILEEKKNGFVYVHPMEYKR